MGFVYLYRVFIKTNADHINIVGKNAELTSDLVKLAIIIILTLELSFSKMIFDF